MPQLNEYSIEELKDFLKLLDQTPFLDTPQFMTWDKWVKRITEAIADRELSDSQLPFRTPKEIEQDERINNAKFI